nr:CHASE2 domain-containing protein [Pseudomonadota bacterium]
MASAGAPRRRRAAALGRLLSRGRGRPLALGLLLLLLILPWMPSQDMAGPLRLAVFDTWQRHKPRAVSPPVTAIIAVDEDSVARYGQWPWPRTLVAELVARTASLGAEAIGLDVFMPEPDRLSPAQFVASYPNLDPELRRRLAQLPSTDELLANTIAHLPVVVGRVAVNRQSIAATAEAPPQTQFMVQGQDPRRHLPRFKTRLTSLPVIDRASRGYGFLNSEADPDGRLRRVPLLLAVGDDVAPSLTLEMVRVALRANWFTVHSDAGGIRGVQIGDAVIPSDPDGGITLYFSPNHPQRHYSAAKVLEGHYQEGELAGRLALIGVTALGLTDAWPTPVASFMKGVEIHAQAIDNLLDNRLAGSRLIRPGYALGLETALLAAAGLTLVAIMPLLRPALSLLPCLALALLFFGGSFAAFSTARLLIDPAYPTLGVVLVGLTMAIAAWIDAGHRRRQLKRENLRITGELRLVRQIQENVLPDPGAIAGLPANLAVHAMLEPAREVGGDFYDLFMLDEHRLFFVVGDVSDKGARAALFMTVSRALCKSSALRGGDSVGAIVTTANQEIARENPGQLFVTAVAGILDARNGGVDYCIAGHDAPVLA